MLLVIEDSFGFAMMEHRKSGHPRHGGIATFLRAPHEPEFEGTDADIGFFGVPWDTGTAERTGTRFGPRYIRHASTIIKRYNPVLDVDLNDYDIIDTGDILAPPHAPEETYDNIRKRTKELLDEDLFPVIGGGNHSIPWPVLQALSDEYGPVSLIHFDAHSDQWPDFFGHDHPSGTWVHHAIEEDLINPETSIRIGDRGSMYNKEDIDRYDESDLDYYMMDEVHEIGVESLAEIMVETVEGPTYVTIDMDVMDPAYAPGVGVPTPDGLETRELFTFLRRLTDVDVVAFDQVELCPPYDDNGNITAILSANMIFETLCASLAESN